MTDTIQPAARVQPVPAHQRPAPTPAPAAAPVQEAAAADAPPPPVEGGSDPAQPAPHKDAMKLSVDRDDRGVFVYTLTDSASGRVIAVIPRQSAQTHREGLDIQA